MFFGGKKNKKQKDGPPGGDEAGKALNFAAQIAVLAVIGYAFVQYISGSEPPKESALGSATPAKETATKNEHCLCIPDEGARLFGALWPAPEPYIHHEALTEGAGLQALCGQDVTLKVRPVGDSYYAGEKDTPFTFRAGAREAMRGLELGALDMRVGGTHRLTVPPDYAYRDSADPAAPKNALLTLDVDMLEARPAAPVSGMPSRAFLTSMGQGGYAKCGDRVAVQLDLWSEGSKLLFSTRMGDHPAGPLTFTLGMGQAPFAIEQALLSLRPGSDASFIFPAAFLTRFNPPQGEAAAAYPPLPGNVPWPESGVAVVDMTLIEILGQNKTEGDMIKDVLPLLLGGKEERSRQPQKAPAAPPPEPPQETAP